MFTTLSRSSRRLLLVVHITASVALLGEVWALLVLSLTGLYGDNRDVYPLIRTLAFTGGIPMSLLALTSGVLLGLGTSWGVLRHRWVAAKLLMLLLTIVIGATLVDPAPMIEAGATGELPRDLQVRQVMAVATQLLLLLSAVVLSVYKPKGQINWSRLPGSQVRSRLPGSQLSSRPTGPARRP